MIKLSNEEKVFLDKMSAITKKEKSIVVDLCLAIINVATLEFYKGNNSFYIPYICKIDIEEKPVLNIKDGIEETKVFLTATPCDALLAELKAIREDNTTPSEKYIKKRIAERQTNLLDIHDMEIEID